jgi:hypothetical protein
MGGSGRARPLSLSLSLNDGNRALETFAAQTSAPPHPPPIPLHPHCRPRPAHHASTASPAEHSLPRPCPTCRPGGVQQAEQGGVHAVQPQNAPGRPAGRRPASAAHPASASAAAAQHFPLQRHPAGRITAPGSLIHPFAKSVGEFKFSRRRHRPLAGAALALAGRRPYCHRRQRRRSRQDGGRGRPGQRTPAGRPAGPLAGTNLERLRPPHSRRHCGRC